MKTEECELIKGPITIRPKKQNKSIELKSEKSSTIQHTTAHHRLGDQELDREKNEDCKRNQKKKSLKYDDSLIAYRMYRQRFVVVTARYFHKETISRGAI